MLDFATEQLTDGCDEFLWCVDKSKLVALMTRNNEELDWQLRDAGCAEEKAIVLRLASL